VLWHASQIRPPHVGYEILAAVVLNFAIFWDIVPCSSYDNRNFERKHHLHLQVKKSAKQETSVQHVARLISTLKMEVILSSEASVHIRLTRSYIPEDGNIQYFLPPETI
jgi:hypothetical protein